MQTLVGKFSALVGDKRGVTAIEYGLITGLVAVAIITSMTTIGVNVARVFTTLAAALP
jgi:pilus assembly protein Flp/PilA